MENPETVLLEDEHAERLTLLQAAKDLGFVFWLFTAFIGAPSIVSLMQTVFIDFQLSSLFQWVVDGYRQLLGVIASVLNPVANVLLNSFNGLLNLELTLQDHWQPLFVVLTLFISANTRSLWDDGYKKPAIVFVATMAVFTLLGAWIAGLIQPDAVWWLQGLAAGMPVLCLFMGMTLAYAISFFAFGFSQPYRKPLWSYVRRGFGLGASAFVLGAALSLSNLIQGHAGLLVLFSGLFFYGLYWVREGFRDKDIPEVRFGLRVVGGFLFAIIVTGIDFSLSMLAYL
ncbi:MAG: hypothetical protein AAF613_10145 [Pseudomonadota bacterium]